MELLILKIRKYAQFCCLLNLSGFCRDGTCCQVQRCHEVLQKKTFPGNYKRLYPFGYIVFTHKRISVIMFVLLRHF